MSVPKDKTESNTTDLYQEAAPIRLSERDSIAFVNAIKYPPKPNDFLKEVMRKYASKS